GNRRQRNLRLGANAMKGRAFAMLLLAMLAAGCHLLEIGTGHRCIDNLDCELGQVCELESGKCVDSGYQRPLSVVDIQVVPAKSSGAVATQFASVDLAKVDSRNLKLKMPAPVSLAGSVKFPETTEGLSGTLVALRRPGFDGKSLTWSIQVDDSGSFEQKVAPGVYDLVFKPADRQRLAQLRVEGVELGSDTSLNLNFLPYARVGTDELERQDPLLVLHGRVLESPDRPHPVAGLVVEAIAENGVRSNLARPDQNGEFYLKMPVVWHLDDAGVANASVPKDVDIVIGPEDPTVRLPTVKVEGARIDDYRLGTFYTGSVSSVVAVSGVVLDRDGRPVGGCMLRFDVDEVGAGTFFLQVEADSDGQFSTTLPAGKVSLTVVPPAAAEVAMKEVEFELDSDRQLMIELGPRQIVGGQVTDELGQAVGNVIVRLQRISDASGRDDGISTTFESTSGPSGQFEVMVDQGRYRLELLPPAASGYPRTLPRIVYVTSDTWLEPFATRLPRASVVEGNVFDSGGQPLCGALIEFYYSVDESQALLIGQTASGTTISECTGEFSLLLPAGIQKSR
ncbi:MAG: hypothetical protein D6806_06795, partial [Deltaproteobacteria bacterium]